MGSEKNNSARQSEVSKKVSKVSPLNLSENKSQSYLNKSGNNYNYVFDDNSRNAEDENRFLTNKGKKSATEVKESSMPPSKKSSKHLQSANNEFREEMPQ